MKLGAFTAASLLAASIGTVYWRATEPLVTAVHPATEDVPANLLRLYVDFSRSMAGDDVFEHVRLLDDLGRPIPDAFRELELWSRDNRRLMLYIHPGRVKTGLALGEKFGPVIEQGKAYTLEIRPGMRSLDGRRVARHAARTIRVGPPCHTMPDLSRWILAAAADRLEIVPDAWLDHAGLEEFLRVDGVPGKCRVDGRRVTFRPDRPFTPGIYRLIVDARLEDLAGNNFIRPFETPSGESTKPADLPGSVARTFSVPGPGQGR